jgi:hypothetical protein
LREHRAADTMAKAAYFGDGVLSRHLKAPLTKSRGLPRSRAPEALGARSARLKTLGADGEVNLPLRGALNSAQEKDAPFVDLQWLVPLG